MYCRIDGTGIEESILYCTEEKEKDRGQDWTGGSMSRQGVPSQKGSHDLRAVADTPIGETPPKSTKSLARN